MKTFYLFLHYFFLELAQICMDLHCNGFRATVRDQLKSVKK